MSGEKTIRIALQRLYRRQVVEPLIRSLGEQTVDTIRSEVRAQFEADLAAVRTRQARVEHAVRQMGEQAQALERATSQRLDEHIAEVEQRVAEAKSDLRTELAAVERDVRAELAEQRQEYRTELGRIGATVEAMAADRARAADVAARSLDDATIMHDLIADTLPHQRFAPGRLARIEQDMAGARAHLADGRPEAAVVTAQAAFTALADLRVDVELAHREWIALRAEVRRALRTLDERITANSRASVLDRQDEALARSTFDVDHWSSGALRVLHDEVAAEAAAVTDGDPTIDQLRAYLEQRLPAYEARLGEIVETARRRVWGAQARANIADLVADALENGFAYHTEQWTHQDNDQREAVFVRLEHLSGNEIVVEVAPAGDDPTASRLQVRSFDHDSGSVAQRHARITAITEHLRSMDMPVSEPIEGGEPDPSALPPEIELRSSAAPRPEPGARSGPA